MSRIIMIDDDPDDQFFYGQLFNELDQTIEFESYSTVEAFLSQEGEKTDIQSLILLDLNMPKESGLDFIKKQTNNGVFRGIPIIVLTTSSSPLDMEDCKNQGIHSYFIKPLNYEDCQTVAAAIYQYWFKHNQLNMHA